MEGYVRNWNPAAETIFGYSAEEAIGQLIIDLIVPQKAEVLEQVHQIAEGLTHKGQLSQVEHENRRKDGSIILCRWFNTPLTDNAGKPFGVASMALDVTEIQRATQALTEREAQLRTLIDTIPDLVWFKNSDGVYIAYNQAFKHFFVGNDNNIIGKTDFDIFDQNQAEFFREYDNKALVAGKSIIKEERIYSVVDGHFEFIETIKTPVYGANRTSIGILGIGRNITERKLAEETLRKSEERFRTMVNYSFGWEFWISLDGKFIINSPSCERMTGYDLNDFSNDADLIVKIIHPNDQKKFKEHLEFPNSVEGTPYCQMLDFRIITRDGHERWLSHICHEVFDQNGNSLGRRASHVDITDRKLAEAKLQMVNAELEQRVKERTKQLEVSYKELESFSYSVSHDLRSPLQIIRGFSEALLEDYQQLLDVKGKHYLSRICTGTQRMGDLIDDLLKLSNATRSELTVTECDLSWVCSQVASYLADLNPERRVEVSIQPGILVQADNRLIRVALENLLGNAWKFTSKLEDPRIEVGETVSPQGDRTFFIRDNGAGFDMAHADKLFNAFQRLHAATDFEGTGIGLAIVQRIIHRHGGRIWAEAKPGEGATFFFTIPEPIM